MGNKLARGLMNRPMNGRLINEDSDDDDDDDEMISEHPNQADSDDN